MKKMTICSMLFIALCIYHAKAQNLMNLNDWVAGGGPTAGFNLNGPMTENLREWGDGPHGNRVVLWKAIPSGDGENDGGFNSLEFPINHQKMYRYTVWIKKTNSKTGRSYFGCGGVNTLAGVANTNPYFWNGNLPELDKWYLLVAYIHASNDASTTSLGGIYDGVTGVKVLPMTDYKFAASATSNKLRAYLYYDPNANDRQYFYAPRVEEVNGNEPTIASLLNSSNRGEDFYFAGKVGIKTDTPGEYDLAVNGKIRSHEIKVETANWPDYVFEEGYNLKTLSEIEKYIKMHGHLPEMPKALQAEANGVSLGEMDKLLLKKIEELTLHMIEKEREIERLMQLEVRLGNLEKMLDNSSSTPRLKECLD